MRRVAAFALPFLLLVTTPATTAPKETCGPLAVLEQTLRSRYQEEFVASGVAASETHAILIYVNRRTFTFSIVAVDTKLTACLLAVGNGWRLADHGRPS